MSCLCISGVFTAVGAIGEGIRNTCTGGRMEDSSWLVGHSRCQTDRAKQIAEARLGRLPVQGRYHCLPRRLEDDYELARGKKLGEGCHGAVILANSLRTGAAYAVKSFKTVGMEASHEKNLASEVGIYLSLDHPHVARLMGVYESKREISMVMECCEGGELYSRLQNKGIFTEEEAARATWQMLLAVNYLHKEGIVHRDLKLENFLYERKDNDFIKLIDFGFSNVFQKSIEMHESLGTIHYVAPEVLHQSYVGGSCDMWSLGVIVFALLAGHMPFDGRSNSAIMRAIKRGRFTMHKAYWWQISDDAQHFVKSLLVVRPSDRMTAQQALAHPWMASRRNMDLASNATILASGNIAESFLSFAEATRFQQACMQIMAWTLPAEERRLLRDIFLKMDTLHAGVLRFPELDKVFKETYHMSKLDRKAVHKALEVLDVDQDGELHYSDLLAVMMAPRLKQINRDAVEETFRRFDAKGLGYLTEEGLSRTLGEVVTQLDLHRTFRLVDVDGDGKIRLDEFVAYLHGAPALCCNPHGFRMHAEACLFRAGA